MDERTHPLRLHRDKSTKLLIPDPVQAPVVRCIYRRSSSLLGAIARDDLFDLVGERYEGLPATAFRISETRAI